MSFEPIDLRVYDQLVTEIYKIGTGENTPQDFLSFYGAIFPSQGSSILGFDHERPAQDIFAFAGFDVSWLDAYTDHYSKIHPYAQAIMQSPPLRITSGTDYISDEDLQKTEYYNDYLKPLGDISQARGMMVFKEKDRFLMWSNLYSPKFADEAAVAETFLEMLTPHLRRSLELARQLDLQSQITHSLEAALDSFSSAVFVCGSDMTIKFANHAADQQMSAGTLVSAHNNRLRFSNAAINSQIRQKVQGLAQNDFGAESMGSELFIRISSPLSPAHFAFITPLPEEATSQRTVFSKFFERPVMIMLVDPNHKPSTRQDIVQLVFNVTPTEAALACALADGMTPGEYADARSISKNTARVQTQALLSKMGARRQSDITRKLATAFAGLNLE